MAPLECVHCGKTLAPSAIKNSFCDSVCEREIHRILSFVSPSPSELDFWRQYRILQNDFLNMLEFVAPIEENKDVCSDRLLAMIRGIGAEVDSICKKLVPTPTGRRKNDMRHWRTFLEGTYSLSRKCVLVPRFSSSVRPFAEFALDESPKWWSAYTDLKHRRQDFFRSATLQNALNGLAALLILNIIQLEPVFDKMVVLSSQTPPYSDDGLLQELTLLFSLLSPGFEVRSVPSSTGLLSVIRILKAS